jgi:hypothetical protein
MKKIVLLFFFLLFCGIISLTNSQGYHPKDQFPFQPTFTERDCASGIATHYYTFWICSDAVLIVYIDYTTYDEPMVELPLSKFSPYTLENHLSVGNVLIARPTNSTQEQQSLVLCFANDSPNHQVGNCFHVSNVYTENVVQSSTYNPDLFLFSLANGNNFVYVDLSSNAR